MTSCFPPKAMASPRESFRKPPLSLPNRAMIDLCLKFPYEGLLPRCVHQANVLLRLSD